MEKKKKEKERKGERKGIKRRQWKKEEKGGEIFEMLLCSLGLNTDSSTD